MTCSKILYHLSFQMTTSTSTAVLLHHLLPYHTWGSTQEHNQNLDTTYGIHLDYLSSPALSNARGVYRRLQVYIQILIFSVIAILLSRSRRYYQMTWPSTRSTCWFIQNQNRTDRCARHHRLLLWLQRQTWVWEYHIIIKPTYRHGYKLNNHYNN